MLKPKRKKYRQEIPVGSPKSKSCVVKSKRRHVPAKPLFKLPAYWAYEIDQDALDKCMEDVDTFLNNALTKEADSDDEDKTTGHYKITVTIERLK